MHFIQKIDAWAAVRPDSLAFVHRNDKLSYRELKNRSDALAARILAELPGDKQPIIVYGHKESAMVISFLASVKAGHPYIPIDYSTPQQRVREIIAGAEPVLLIDLTDGAADWPQTLPVYKQSDLANIYQADKLLADFSTFVQQQDDYYIIYTSGSSGSPKGVRITLECLQSFTDWIVKEFVGGKTEPQTYMNQAPFSFDLSVLDLYLSLITGGTLWCIDKDMIARPRDLFNGFRETPLNVWVSTPSFAEYCLVDRSFEAELLPKLAVFIFCGEVLTNDCAHKLRQRFPAAKVFNTYGPTESTVMVTSVQVTDEILEKYNPLPIGYVKGDNRISLVEDEVAVTEDFKQGELIISGPCVSPGYLNDDERTRQRFSTINGKRGYKTGDCGYFADKLLFYCGRKDNQIKIHGFRVELEEIEFKITTLPYVGQAIVIPKALADGKNQYLFAGIVLNEDTVAGQTITPLSIKQDLKTVLPDYMIPHKILLLDAIPITNNGKIDRKKVAEILL